MCRNVQTTLGMNLRTGPVRPRTHLNFPAAPQTKNGNHFFLPTPKSIDLSIFFLIKKKTIIRRQKRYTFLDASTHLYMRLCPSVRRTWVCPSVGQAFLKHRGNEDFKTMKHRFFERLGGKNGFHFSFGAL